MLSKYQHPRSVLFVIAFIMATVGMLATLVCAGAAELSSARCYKAPMEEQSYIDSVRAKVDEQLDLLCIIAELPRGGSVSAAVSDEQLKTMSLEYMDHISDYVTGKTEHLEAVGSDPAVFAEIVEGRDDAQMLSEDLADAVRAGVMSVDEGRMLSYARTRVTRVAPVLELAARMLPVAGGVTLIGLVIALALCGRGRNRFYGLAGMLWVVSAAAAVPVWIFGSQPWMEQIVLEDSPLKVWLGSVYSSEMGLAKTVTAALFGLCTLLLLTAVIVAAVKRGRDGGVNMDWEYKRYWLNRENRW